MTHGERVKTIRKTLNLTLEKFGQKLGVGKTAISKIEKCERSLTEQMLKSICREFNVNEEWLRNETGEIFKSPNDEVATILSEIMQNPDSEFYQIILKLVHTYLELSPESQRVMDEYIHSFTNKIKNGTNLEEKELSISKENIDYLSEAPQTPEELEQLFPLVNIEDILNIG